MITVEVLHCGTVNVDNSLPYEEKTLHPYPVSGWLRPQSKRGTYPVSAYLISHPKGTILVDTGWSTEMRNNPRKHLGWLPYSFFQGELPAGLAIHEQLKDRGIETKDLDFVIMTHLHSDHASGLTHVADAKKILVHEEEWRAANRSIAYIKRMWKGINITTFANERIPYGPYHEGVDLFGDGTIHLVFTPGHANGLISVLVKTEQGYILLASDVGYGKKSWREMVLPGVKTNRKKAYDSLQWVKQFADREDCIAVIVNHDPEIQPGIVVK